MAPTIPLVLSKCPRRLGLFYEELAHLTRATSQPDYGRCIRSPRLGTDGLLLEGFACQLATGSQIADWAIDVPLSADCPGHPLETPLRIAYCLNGAPTGSENPGSLLSCEPVAQQPPPELPSQFTGHRGAGHRRGGQVRASFRVFVDCVER